MKVVWHHATVTREKRQEKNNHKSVVAWFTGLSGAGKSTLAHAVEEVLYENMCNTFVLDGDNVRHGLSSDLGFNNNDRHENLRRIGEVSKLFVESGVIVLTAFISPFQEDRDAVRRLLPHGDFLEIYVSCPIGVCEKRDIKGLYKKARQGEIDEFTGVSSPYEVPIKPDLVVNTKNETLEESVEKVLALLASRGVFSFEQR